LATHNRFYNTVEERDASLMAAFKSFQDEPARIDGHVRRYREAEGTLAIAA
jgi:adenine deaminase